MSKATNKVNVSQEQLSGITLLHFECLSSSSQMQRGHISTWGYIKARLLTERPGLQLHSLRVYSNYCWLLIISQNHLTLLLLKSTGKQTFLIELRVEEIKLSASSKFTSWLKFCGRDPASKQTNRWTTHVSVQFLFFLWLDTIAALDIYCLQAD